VNQNKVYGAALPILTASYSGFVNGDTTASLTTAATLTTTATAASPVGTYPITVSGAVDTNYTISYVAGTLTVSTATLTITASNQSKIYGVAIPTLTATYSGFVNGDTAASLTTAPTLSTTATASSPVGTYPITASGAVDTNYAISYVAGTLTITQSSISGTIVSSANPSLPGTNVTFTETLSAVLPGVGTPSGTVNFRIDGTVAGSGTLSGGMATFTTSSLTHGSHTVGGEYAGDLNFPGITNTLAQNQSINTPPVTTNVTIERYPTQGVKVRLATLLANDSDADGDSLSIVVNATSANAGTVTESSGWVFYTPAPGFTNADSFNYTIQDGFGGSAVGTVIVAIIVDNSPGLSLTLINLGNGSFLINGSGVAGRTYRLQYNGSLDTPNWQFLPGGTLTANSVGIFQFVDNPGLETTRYYRSVYP
jgi:hypothetical protein